MIPKFSPTCIHREAGRGALPGSALSPRVMSNNDLSGQQAVHPEPGNAPRDFLYKCERRFGGALARKARTPVISASGCCNNSPGAVITVACFQASF